MINFTKLSSIPGNVCFVFERLAIHIKYSLFFFTYPLMCTPYVLTPKRATQALSMLKSGFSLNLVLT